ncbi:MAG: hypothetical protein ACK46L_00495 [Synechococcaceae cyanobacterium]|jgi:hypothetical protein
MDLSPPLEELQPEAREALIDHLGPAHRTVRMGVRVRFRMRVRRDPGTAVSSIQPVGRRPATLCR